MKETKTYSRRVRAGGQTYTIYAAAGDLDEKYGVEVHNENGYRFFIREGKGSSQVVSENVGNVVLLPDEQSWSTIFPLDILMLGKKRMLVRVMDRITQMLRAGSSPVKCFRKGCRNRALFYAETPNSGGCWYACGEQHMSDVTTRQFPISRESYKPVKIPSIMQPQLRSDAKLQQEK